MSETLDETTSVITIVVNGDSQTLPPRTSIGELIKRLGIRSPAIAVELNASLLTRDQYNSTMLCDGDQLEVVTLVGGG